MVPLTHTSTLAKPTHKPLSFLSYSRLRQLAEDEVERIAADVDDKAAREEILLREEQRELRALLADKQVSCTLGRVCAWIRRGYGVVVQLDAQSLVHHE